MVHVTEWMTWVVLIFVFELKYSSIIKILVSLPFVLLYLCFDICCNDRVFGTGADGVADGSVEDHLEWLVLLGIS